MLGWYRELSTGERRTFWGCFGGWSLDAMDAQLFPFLLPSILLSLGITRGEAGLIGTASLIASSVGGWAAGTLADRYGRVRVLQWSILWYSAFTLLSAFTQTFNQLLVVRIFEGFGFGGEWAAGAVLMGEMIRAEHRGKAVGCVQSAFAVGWFTAALLSTVMLAMLPAEWAWRVVFAIGVLPAFLVIYIRRHMQEPPLFARAQRAETAEQRRLSPFAIFGPGVWRTTLLTGLLAAGVQGSSAAVLFWLPTFLATVRHLTATGAGSYVMVVTFGAFCGYISSAYLTDAVGRRRNFLLFGVGCWLIDFAYMLLPVGNTGILILGFPLGYFSQGIYASLGPYFSELFPTHIRATGQSFSYNFGRSAGALLITLVSVLAEFMPLGTAIGLLSLGGYAVAIIATLLLPETRGISLESAGMPQPAAPLARSIEGTTP